MDQTVFNKPTQNPAISAAQGQQSIQKLTTMTQKSFMPQAQDTSDLDYKAYKLSQQARGLPVLPPSAWKMTYRHQQMLNNGA